MYKPDNENLQKANYFAKNKFNIPSIVGFKKFDENIEFIGFNYCKSMERSGNVNYGVHFFLDDYQFNRLWHNPDKYMPLLAKFRCVLSPDFSLYLDYPKAIQIYKHYQKHWLGRYMQDRGIKVIPTICWSDKESYRWCFDGEPRDSVVAVSSIGTQRNNKSKQLFLEGYAEMLKRLKPTKVLFWGNIPAELDRSIIVPMGYIMDEKFKSMRIGK